jgi:hypothetical protein
MYEQPSRFKAIMKQIWPFINRAINTSIYFVIGIIKEIVSEGMKMIKNQY